MATNEDLMHAIQEARAEIKEVRIDLKDHVDTEQPILDSAKVMIASHGTDEMIRARINFVNSWMKREEHRDALRRKIIESAAIWSVILLLGFIGYALRDTLMDIIRAGVTKEASFK